MNIGNKGVIMEKEKNLMYFALRISEEVDIPITQPFYEERLWEFLISLRYVANYQGEILAFDYGSEPHILEKMEGDFGVDIIPIEVGENHGVGIRCNLTNRRNIDVIPYLEQGYKDYKFITYDFDCWFQDSIDEFWDELDDVKGCYYSVELHRSCRYRGPDSSRVEAEYNDVQGKLGGFVWGGLQSGKYKPFIDRLKLMADLFDTGGWKVAERGTDQALITYTVDFKNDKLDAWRWGFDYYFVEIKDNKVVSKMKWYDGPVAVIHLNASLSRGKSEYLRFKNLHPDLWNKYK
jgi:hypothetical protein